MKEEQKPITQTYITCKVNYVVIIISIGAGVFVGGLAGRGFGRLSRRIFASHHYYQQVSLGHV